MHIEYQFVYKNEVFIKSVQYTMYSIAYKKKKIRTDECPKNTSDEQKNNDQIHKYEIHTLQVNN